MKNLINSYLSLNDSFYKKVLPSSAVNPSLILFNDDLSNFLNLDINSDEEILTFFSGQKISSSASPIALAYAGHQFGHFVPQLGDGRAILLGSVKAKDDKLYDIQLKGSGKTPFSRGGDGRSALGPVIREYILSESMHALGIPTTRALAAIKTGDKVQRETLLEGAIFTRVASSHIRIGTFEYFAARKDLENLKKLTLFAIDRHYSQLSDLSTLDEKCNSFFSFLSEKLIELVTSWMSIGFIHGVMNTDNMSISGETIDYGPCAFMDEFKFSKVFSSIDRNGRYSFQNQASILHWNLSSLANCLSLIVSNSSKLDEQLNLIPNKLEKMIIEKFGEKLGIKNNTDLSIITEFLTILEQEELDFTNSFRKIIDDLQSHTPGLSRSDNYLLFLNKLKSKINDEEESVSMMMKVNPSIIPRNHQVQKAIDLAYNSDFSFFKKLVTDLKSPYSSDSNLNYLKELPLDHERVHATFCGT